MGEGQFAPYLYEISSSSNNTQRPGTRMGVARKQNKQKHFSICKICHILGKPSKNPWPCPLHNKKCNFFVGGKKFKFKFLLSKYYLYRYINKLTFWPYCRKWQKKERRENFEKFVWWPFNSFLSLPTCPGLYEKNATLLSIWS